MPGQITVPAKAMFSELIENPMLVLYRTTITWSLLARTRSRLWHVTKLNKERGASAGKRYCDQVRTLLLPTGISLVKEPQEFQVHEDGVMKYAIIHRLASSIQVFASFMLAFQMKDDELMSMLDTSTLPEPVDVREYYYCYCYCCI